MFTNWQYYGIRICIESKLPRKCAFNCGRTFTGLHQMHWVCYYMAYSVSTVDIVCNTGDSFSLLTQLQLYVCIFLQHYRIHMNIGNSNNSLRIKFCFEYSNANWYHTITVTFFGQARQSPPVKGTHDHAISVIVYIPTFPRPLWLSSC